MMDISAYMDSFLESHTKDTIMCMLAGLLGFTFYAGMCIGAMT